MEEQNFVDSRRVKHEPPVEFVLILPRPTIGWPAIKQEKDVKPKRIPTVKFAKFDEKWKSKAKLFQSFFTCPNCQLVMNRNLVQHMRVCSKISPEGFKCDFCDKRFEKKRAMRSHVLRHCSEKKFCCTKCGHGFKTKNQLLIHSRAKKIYKCTACNVIFSCKLLLERHRSDFHGNVFKCDKCSYKTKRQQHFMSHKGSHDKSFACDTCQKKFSTDRCLKHHQMQHRHGIHATTAEETFDCEKCGKSFTNLQYLRLHEKRSHDDNEVKCEVCDRVCKNQHSLLQHSQIHNKVECSICHKMFSKNLIASHLRSHSVANHFRCDLCDLSTTTKGHLKKHIERMHLLKKLVNDSRCREDFSEFESLKKLQLKHGSSATTNEKKFECDKCPKAFITPTRLYQHKRTVHLHKLFECAFCKKAYKVKSQLKYHEAKVHSKK